MTDSWIRARRLWAGALVAVGAVALAGWSGGRPARALPDQRWRPGSFDRIATYDVSGEVAEIVAATPDGRTLIYTDSAEKELGFVNIANPFAPVELGTLPVNGEPTSVAVTPNGKWALACVHGAPEQLVVVDLSDRSVEAIVNLGGQPDSVAISPNGRYAAIAIENQRDESLNGGAMPQGPAGFLTIVDLVGAPGTWSTRDVALTGLADRFADDPEPEYVDINAKNIAAVTLQENNHVALVDLKRGEVIADWSAGATSHLADTATDSNIVFDDLLTNARREPDAIVWTPDGNLLTANEGDYTVDLVAGQFVGGRDFTLFDTDGDVVHEPGADLELQAVRHGHYPDSRSSRKGAEIEGAEIGVFFGVPYAFVGSERGNFVAVYRLDDEEEPRFLQLLPTGVSPEGLLAIPQRHLFVTANEGNGTISIFRYHLRGSTPEYPDVFSDVAPWSALSGLASTGGREFYAVPDSAFKPSRIWKMDVSGPGRRAEITGVLPLPKSFDLEGIAIRPQGGWWVVSEGAGNAGQPTATGNLLVRVNPDGSIAQEVPLPAEVTAQQRQFGFEGVATTGDGAQVYVCFQREWGDDPAGFVKIGRYTPATGAWAFFRYPLDAAPAGGWVGLSEITRLDDNTFAILERDNQARQAARVKRIYRISVTGIKPVPVGGTLPAVQKTLVRDLLAQDGFLLEKAEGMALLGGGHLLVVNDNDGSGETRLFRSPAK